jgi:hypothetical protein
MMFVYELDFYKFSHKKMTLFRLLIKKFSFVAFQFHNDIFQFHISIISKKDSLSLYTSFYLRIFQITNNKLFWDNYIIYEFLAQFSNI